ncbi:MAG: UDP-N-acetylglucosamine 2-epimerase [Helicobacter sp.]|nr:UDP-N-acetylglucosamine 2-epimerase [Helicobacter sp.]
MRAAKRLKSKLNFQILHTNQHFSKDMSELFCIELGFTIDFKLSPFLNNNHLHFIEKARDGIASIILEHDFSHILVFGDTNSTLAGALAAKLCKKPCIHVESGLRSFDLKMPEEVNRIFSDCFSDILFTPNVSALVNLKHERKLDLLPIKSCIFNVGDINYDAFLEFEKYAKEIEMYKYLKKDFILCTIHRAQNSTKEQLHQILQNLARIKCQILFLVHPRIKDLISNFISNHDIGEIILHPPIGFLEMIFLLKKARLVITDSGGLQKEAYFAKKHSIILRNTTEWRELVEHNYSKLLDPLDLPNALNISFDTITNCSIYKKAAVKIIRILEEIA